VHIVGSCYTDVVVLFRKWCLRDRRRDPDGWKHIRKFAYYNNYYVCLFSWPYNQLWLYFHSPVAGFSLLVFEVSWSHTTTRHSRQDSSGWVINPSQRPLPDNTQHSQQTNIHALGGIRAAEDLSLRPRGHWDRHNNYYSKRIYGCVFIHQDHVLIIISTCLNSQMQT
jgi:hypothetical protein